MDPKDGAQHTAHAVVEKWSAKTMTEVHRKHGKRRFERDELVALGHHPDEVTDDGTVVPTQEA